ncbi:MAG: trigger factor [Gammaproteobacteria bacterium]|nr:trigger factor [Gammaproteobacteria bacterium]
MRNIIVNLEPLEGTKKCMRVRVPGERIEYYNNIIRHQSDDESVDTLLTKFSFNDAVEYIGIMPASPPEFYDVTSIKNGGYSFTATFEAYPDITVPKLNGFKVTRLKAEVTEDDVQQTILKMRKQHCSWHEVDRPAEMGDRVILDLHTTIDNIKVHETDVDATLGQNDLLEGLDDGLPGVIAGDDLTLDLKFPDVFYPDLAGKRALFSIRIKRIEELVIPDSDMQFIKDHGVPSGELEHFRNAIRTGMEKQLQDAIQMRTTIEIMASLIAKNPFDVPNTLVSREVARLISDPDSEDGSQALDLDPEDFTGLARKRIARSIMAYRLSEHYGISIDEERVRSRVEELTRDYPDPENKIAWYYEDRTRMQWIESEVLEQQVVEWIMDRVEVIDLPSSYDEVMAMCC